MPKSIRNLSAQSNSKPKNRPALSPEAREQQLIAKAVNLAEKQLDEGTASSQVMTHFLKLGTEKARLEKAKLEHENELLKAKTEALQSSKRMEELYAEAINAMKNYSGYGGDDNGNNDEY